LDTGTVADTDTDAVTAPDTANGPDATWSQPPIWDMAKITDPTTANCTFTKQKTAFKDGKMLTVWRVSYTAWESIDGQLKPITIAGYAARPSSAGGKLPGVVQAHGLGGHAKESHATGPAALLGMFVLAYTGPGGGDSAENKSGGLPSGHDGGKRIFDVIPDVRGSWFWGHSVAAMRGLTCLETRPDVDAARLGITGYSAGGVVSFIASGQDKRIKAAVPLSGLLAWDKATLGPNAWQHVLLAKAGLSTASPRWKKMMQTLISPSVALSGLQAAVFLVDGSMDEFFPLNAANATMAAVKTPHRLSIAANYDHGCFAVYGPALPGGAKAIEAGASLRATGAQRAWFRHHFKSDPAYNSLPKAPVATAQTAGAATLLVANVDPGPPALAVQEVRAWASNDNGWLFASTKLDKKGGSWSKLVPSLAGPSTVWFVDVTYVTTAKLLPERFSLSSTPVLPAGHIPKLAKMSACTP